KLLSKSFISGLNKSLVGLGDFTPAVKYHRLSTLDFFIASSTLTSSQRTWVRPIVFSSLNNLWTQGFLKSQSIRSTLKPLWAIAIARLTLIIVLPMFSLKPAIITFLEDFWANVNLKFTAKTLKASANEKLTSFSVIRG